MDTQTNDNINEIFKSKNRTLDSLESTLDNTPDWYEDEGLLAILKGEISEARKRVHKERIDATMDEMSGLPKRAPYDPKNYVPTRAEEAMKSMSVKEETPFIVELFSDPRNISIRNSVLIQASWNFWHYWKKSHFIDEGKAKVDCMRSFENMMMSIGDPFTFQLDFQNELTSEHAQDFTDIRFQTPGSMLRSVMFGRHMHINVLFWDADGVEEFRNKVCALASKKGVVR